MHDATFSLYVHAPFCKSRCDYCDFYSTVDFGQDTIRQWYESVRFQLLRTMQELSLSGFKTIFIGGGTPSIIPLSILRDLLRFLNDFYDANSSDEWTVEANPEDITKEFLDTLSQAGVTRISVGVQSLDDTVRKSVNRRASSKTILEKLELISKNWKGSWSLDYIYGLPFQDMASIRSDFGKLRIFLPGHVSLYALGVEEGTVLGSNIHAGKLNLPSIDDSIDSAEAVAQFLKEEGFFRYEVSNWERSGQACLHNERYWQMKNWLGIGPSAVSNWLLPDNSYQRVQTVSDLGSYCKNPFLGQETTLISGKDAVFETIMMALRTSSGLNFSAFFDRFSLDIKALMTRISNEFLGFFCLDAQGCSPTDKGMDLLNLPLLKILDYLDQIIPTGE